MKTSKMIILIIIGTLLSSGLFAQVSVGINVGVPAPRYYYLQDIESYFDTQASMYIYFSGGRWIHSRNLPASYGNYDMNNSHRVIIKDYRGDRPYTYYRQHKQNFPKGHYEKQEKNYWSAKEYKDQRKQRGRGDNNYRGSKREQIRMGNDDNRRGNNNGRGNKNGHENNNGRGNKNGHENNNGHGNGNGNKK